MTVNTLIPKPASYTIQLDSCGSMAGLIGLAGRLMLDSGECTWRVCDIMRSARAAAQVSDADALAVLESVGFRFRH